MSDAELLADELIQGYQPVNPSMTQRPPRTGPSERFRSLLQGMSFASADEAEAFLRSLGGEDYETALNDVRQRLRDYRGDKPWEALAYEAGGAALPALAGAVLSGGAGAAAAYPSLARIATVGGLEGATYAFNAGEGGLAERASQTPLGAVSGMAGAGAGYAATRGIGAGLRSLTDVARRKFGPRAAGIVEREVQKAVQDGGYDNMQQAIDDIVNGRILADNKTVASVARAWRAQSAEADDVLRRGLEGRPDRLRRETMDYLQDRMGAPGNAVRQYGMDDAAARRAAGEDYNRIFAQSGALDDEATAGLVDAFRRVPGATNDLDALYRAQTGKQPFFRVTDEGIQFGRNPTLEEAEIMRRAIADSASRQFRTGSGAVGQAVRDVEGNVRGLLDARSPELAATRARWSGIERSREAFDAGRKALSKSPDEVSLAWEAAQGDEATAKAFRAGVVDAYRRKASTGSRKSMPRNMADENTREGQILRMVFPGDDLDEVLRRAQNAADSQEAANTVLGGSPTQITAGRMAEQGTAFAEGVMDAASMSPQAMLRLAGQAIRQMSPEMTPRQAAEAARLVVETNPNVVARALTDASAMDDLYRVIDQATRTGSRVGMTAGGAQGGLLYAR